MDNEKLVTSKHQCDEFNQIAGVVGADHENFRGIAVRI